MADKRMNHVCDDFEEIPGFHSPWNFEKFEESINQMIAEKMIQEVPVGKPYSAIQDQERWIKCPNGDIWRLVSPDFPFVGFFKKVDLK